MTTRRLAGGLLAAAALGALATPAEPARAQAAGAPAEWHGAWRGMGRQTPPGRAAEYPVVMTLTRSGGSIEYPTLNCTGTLTPLSSGGDSVEYREQITRGDCLSGTVIISLVRDRLAWTWTGAHAGTRVDVVAMLEREGGRASASASAAADCEQEDDAARRIRGCSEVLDSGSGAPQARAETLVRRGRAYAAQNELSKALADYGQAVKLDPERFEAWFLRGLLNEYLDRHEAARNDFERALRLVEAAQARQPSEQLTRTAARLRALVTEMTLAAEMEEHWRSYLAEIQAQRDHRNWPGPPRDLYRRNQRAGELEPQPGASSRELARRNTADEEAVETARLNQEESARVNRELKARQEAIEAARAKHEAEVTRVRAANAAARAAYERARQEAEAEHARRLAEWKAKAERDHAEWLRRVAACKAGDRSQCAR
jgi:tetratricopeptide (TPR) repeat protein